jgi:hypothetical protein
MNEYMLNIKVEKITSSGEKIPIPLTFGQFVGCIAGLVYLYGGHALHWPDAQGASFKATSETCT